ncbi:thiol methyltransferase [Raphidocelis subcapitata]|uniref:Thiol methyltransferase n=1 Tax=Raphidocelis subcapitata TaxID=307507 RepID=A0A2V0NJC3_9CHLO|nr:thiol methyltransferase [Raphidocelis subcapitata]|eukprot:GBF87306.1 thiol methyltransferase [Raphidocelis subcapitata]
MTVASGAPGAAQAAAAEAVDAAEYNSRWHGIWEAGLQPGEMFDIGGVSPALSRLLASRDLDLAGRSFLVPGCGRGYDVVAAAAAGAARAVGLDLSGAAVAAAAAHRDATAGPEAAARAHFVQGDFFTYSDDVVPAFDAGYDYTMLCALHPSMRPAWAAAWARLLRPGGHLVTMVYPVDSSLESRPGPPWPVTPGLYKDLLLPAGFELLSLDPIPDHLSHPRRVGREWLGRWRRAGAAPAAVGGGA